MKHSIWLQAWDWSSVALEIALLAFTIWFLPTRLPLRWWGAPCYLAAIALLWLAYAIQAMFLDSFTKQDVPGFGYLIPGFLFGAVGLVAYLGRDWRARQRRKKKGL